MGGGGGAFNTGMSAGSPAAVANAAPTVVASKNPFFFMSLPLSRYPQLRRCGESKTSNATIVASLVSIYKDELSYPCRLFFCVAFLQQANRAKQIICT